MSKSYYSHRLGKVSEERFKRAATSLGFSVYKSSRDEDIYDHIDFWLEVDGKMWAADVKGNNLPEEIWCEFNNVNGDAGWIYGKSHIIAFEMPETGGFIIVDRRDLLAYMRDNVSDEKVDNKRDAYKKKYTRKDRQDVITKLCVSDLKTLTSYRVWAYCKQGIID